jgi:serine/threonine protein phosphatase PrpC
VTVLRSGSASDVGRVRSVNEDLVYEGSSLFAVADGMGGHAGGEVAAQTAIDSLRSGFDLAPSAEGLVDAIHSANKAVWEKGRSDASLRGMGTTLVAAALVGTEEGDRLVLANVGDSRGYRVHDRELEQLTVDHSVAEELVARGELSEDEAAIHPHRHILTRALGVDMDVSVDVWDFVPQEGDRFLLCSDGLSNEVPVEQMSRILTEVRDPQQAAEALVAFANRRGGNDNITALVLDVLVGEPAAGNGAASIETAVRPTRAGQAGEAPGSLGVGTALIARSEEPSQEEAIKPATRKAPPPRRPRSRRVTFRVLLFLVVLGGLAYGAYSAVRWYVNNSYYVGVDHGRVVVFQGRRGGFLGMDPKVVLKSGIPTSDVPSITESSISTGIEEPSRAAADDFVKNLQQQLCAELSPPPGLRCLSPAHPTTSTTAPSAVAPTTTAAVPPQGLDARGASTLSTRSMTTASRRA